MLEDGMEVLYEGPSTGAKVVRDPDNIGNMPIGFEEAGDYIWLDENEIAPAIAAIAAAQGVSVAGVTVNNTFSNGLSGSLNEQLIQVAINHDIEVEFAYAKGSGEVIEHRRLVPTKLDDAKGHKIVTGFDPDRDDVRAYRLDRIKGTVSI